MYTQLLNMQFVFKTGNVMFLLCNRNQSYSALEWGTESHDFPALILCQGNFTILASHSRAHDDIIIIAALMMMWSCALDTIEYISSTLGSCNR